MKLIDIILPASQLEGTSATLTKWLFTLGDQVTEGEPIIELETDKVSMEICAPQTGVLHEILAQEGDEISVDVVLGHINSEKSSTTTNEPTSTTDNDSQANTAQHLIGPAVRRLINTHHLDINNIAGTGRNGRVTRDDVNAHLANTYKVKVEKPQTNNTTANQYTNTQANLYPKSEVQVPNELKGTITPHSPMRKAIAAHMVESLLNTSPHVTSVFEMDMSNIMAHRKWHKKEYAELGVNLTFTAYFLAASAKAAQLVPQVNARFHEHGLEIFSDINIGVGTALSDKGIVVPVVQQVQKLNLFSIAQVLDAQTQKARDGKLTPSDMKNGTFTISNHGVSGSLFATPIIINQPQVAILGIGKCEKRAVVEEVGGVDTLVIKPKCYVSLSIDHRALDAYQTNMFLAEFVRVIETWGE